jgi:GDP-L-fucose synthase
LSLVRGRGTIEDMSYSLAGKSIWVTGHRGMVGSALVRALAKRTDCRVLMAPRQEVDLKDLPAVRRWMGINRPHVIIVAAAKVGGILANDTYPADFLYDNLAISANLIHSAFEFSAEKLLYLGSSCIYPRLAEQPIVEEALLTGPLEPTNQWYAIAKIAGIRLCQAYRKQHGRNFIAGMPTNLYGPNDNFDLSSSHVLPALIRKIHTAKINRESHVVLWGTGKPRREFLYVDDMADACVFLLEHYDGLDHVNIGSGIDFEIGEIARLIADVVGYRGTFTYDTTKPDGMPRKLMDGSKLAAMGWRPRVDIQDGIALAYNWYLKEAAEETRAPALI